MPPPTRSVSTRSERERSTPSLSATFAPPTTTTNGRSGVSRRLAEDFDLSGQQPPGGRGKPRRRADDRGVRPVRGPERVVDVARPGPSRARARRPGRSPPRPASKRRFSSSSTPGISSSSACPDRLQTEGRVRLALGRPRWVQAVTDRAVLDAASASVGSAARMRKSSATTAAAIGASASGTLKSTRTRTRLPVEVPQVLEERHICRHRVPITPTR